MWKTGALIRSQLSSTTITWWSQSSLSTQIFTTRSDVAPFWCRACLSSFLTKKDIWILLPSSYLHRKKDLDRLSVDDRYWIWQRVDDMLKISWDIPYFRILSSYLEGEPRLIYPINEDLRKLIHTHALKKRERLLHHGNWVICKGPAWTAFLSFHFMKVDCPSSWQEKDWSLYPLRYSTGHLKLENWKKEQNLGRGQMYLSGMYG